ncbi:MAG: LSU ribosomal protein L19p, partial [uncultured Thermoleophilia bacterium]
ERHPGDRVVAAAAAAAVQGGRHREGALPCHRGTAPARPGLRGHLHQEAGPRAARDLHRPQAVVRRRCGAHVPRALAEDRPRRGRGDRRRLPREAVLPAREGRQEGACAREAAL